MAKKPTYRDPRELVRVITVPKHRRKVFHRTQHPLEKTVAQLLLRWEHPDIIKALRQVGGMDELQMNLLARYGVMTEKRRAK